MSKRKLEDPLDIQPTKKPKTQKVELDSILDGINEGRPEMMTPELEARQLKEKHITKIVEEIYENSGLIKSVIEENNNNVEIEIEFRIGKFSHNSTKFNSGVHSEEFQFLMEYFTENMEELGLDFFQNMTIDKIYHLPVSNKSIRISFDDENDESDGTVCNKEKNEKYSSLL